MSQYRFFQISRQGKIAACGSLVEAVLSSNQGGYTWADFQQPEPDEIKQLRDAFGLVPQALQDWDTPAPLARTEAYPRNTLVRFPYLPQAAEFGLDALTLFVGEKFLLSLSPRGTSTGAHLENLAPLAPLENGPDSLLAALLGELQRQTALMVDALVERAGQFEQAVLTQPLGFEPVEAANLARQLNAARRCLGQQVSALEKLSQANLPFVQTQAVSFTTLHMQARFQLDRLDNAADHLNSLNSVHVTAALRQADQDQKGLQNRVRRLALLLCLALPLILLSGFWLLINTAILPPNLAGPTALLLTLASAALLGGLIYGVFARGPSN